MARSDKFNLLYFRCFRWVWHCANGHWLVWTEDGLWWEQQNCLETYFSSPWGQRELNEQYGSINAILERRGD